MSGEPCVEGTKQHANVRFTLVGMVASPEFQQSLAIIELLHKKYSARFSEPFIRPMLENDWIEYLKKAQRKYGKKLWRLDKPFIIYVNDYQLGCFDELDNFLAQWYRVYVDTDFQCLAQQGVVDMYEKYMELGRKFVFFSLSLNCKRIGHLIFMLYADIVPKTCKSFIKKCISKRNGFRGTIIHRIMPQSWIQCADFFLPIDSMSNENYVVPHNRRGIISMCNNGPHIDNKSQFFITLDSTPWMDYRYVAFGQLMQGDCVLRRIENLPCTNEYPNDNICFCNCGEITLEDTAMARNLPNIYQYLDDRSDVVDFRDTPSIILEGNYRNLLYCYPDDTECHLPMRNIASYLLLEPSVTSLLRGYIIEESAEEDVEQYENRFSLSDQVFFEEIKEIIKKEPAVIVEETVIEEEQAHPSNIDFLLTSYSMPGEDVHKRRRSSLKQEKSLKSIKSAKSKVMFAPSETKVADTVAVIEEGESAPSSQGTSLDEEVFITEKE